MRRALYSFFTWLGSHVGVWVVAAFAWCVSTGYFLLLPRRLATSLAFYRALFPERGLWARLRLSWRQYHGFASLFAERLRLRYTPERLRCTMEGLEHIDRAAKSGTGAILLMSHVGNWEIGAQLLGQRELPLMLFMGARQKEQVERQQKEDLRMAGVQVRALESGDDATTQGIAGLGFVREGGLVSLAGDRRWSEGQPGLEVPFLQHEVVVPKAPHALALISKAPIITFFVVRTGRCRYHFKAFAPTLVRAARRADRDAALADSAARYAEQLEAMIRSHPTQWYHFERFLPRDSA